MVDIDVNAELKRRQELRQQKMKNVSQKIPLVKVVPASDSMRRMLKHPDAATQFGKTGGVEWPMDQFTQRRLREGAIQLEDAEEQKKVKVRDRAVPVGASQLSQQQQPEPRKTHTAPQTAKPKE
jgi:hypothetical protein